MITLNTDISELNLPRGATIAFVDGKDKLLHFQITMRPKEGIYRRDFALAKTKPLKTQTSCVACMPLRISSWLSWQEG